MRLPQLLIYEGDEKLVALLRPLAEERKWALRQPQQSLACLDLLARGGPAVLVLRAGTDLERELTLLDRAVWLCPWVRAVVILEAVHPALEAVAWDLGAAYVHAPPQARELLPEVVAGLLEGRRP
jgi:hypothetical protein